MKKHLLEENPHFEYYTTVTKENIDFEIYDDLYGNCFYLAWIDPTTQEVKKCSCGAFNNNFHAEIDDIVDSYKKENK